MKRTAPEECNLSTNYNEHDVTKAEFVRTFQSIDFNGKALLRRLEAEQKNTLVRESWKPLPVLKDFFPYPKYEILIFEELLESF